MTIKEMARNLRQTAQACQEAAEILSRITEGDKPNPSIEEVTRKAPRKGMSAAARRKISMAQKKRWRLLRGGKAAA